MSTLLRGVRYIPCIGDYVCASGERSRAEHDLGNEFAVCGFVLGLLELDESGVV